MDSPETLGNQHPEGDEGTRPAERNPARAPAALLHLGDDVVLALLHEVDFDFLAGL